MDIKNAIEYCQNRLCEYGSKIYEYNGEYFIGIRNPYGKNDMAITFREDNMTMEFATQAARFAYGDEKDLADHAEKFLKGELCAVEFYCDGHSLFGGSREVGGMNFKTTLDVAKWYSADNPTITERINKTLCERKIVVECCVWMKTPDRLAISSADGTMTDLAEF